MLRHVADLASSVTVPLSADFEAGYADEAAALGENVRSVIAAGVAGLSIEDATGRSDKPLYDFQTAVERITAARRAIDASQCDVLLTARAECFLVGMPDLHETIRRLEAYALAGADCLYAPGIRSKEDIRAVVRAVAPKPVNVLVGSPGLSVAELADLGVRRISVGGALARAAWGGFASAAREIIEKGTFGAFGAAMPFVEINGFFRNEMARGSKAPA
jgi:2-methylisocitrate lyase-like PEP mutase family enzyme